MATTPNVQNQPTWAKPQPSDIREVDVKWWEAQNIPWQLVRELQRRRNNTNVGQSANTTTVINFENEHATYRGPMTPWVRAFSNGTGQIGSPTVPVSKYLFKNNQLPKYDGFLLSGGDGFGNAYGFTKKGNVLVEDKAILGYQANGEPHYIDPKYRTNTYYDAGVHCPEGVKFPQNSVVPSVLPPPGITSINVKTNKDMMANATINWKCYSLAQLEYMMPFWLSPKINVFLEFGWNLFNIDSLLPLVDTSECYKLILRPELALERYYKSFGNYGLITGIISKYNFSTDDGFVYNCTTELLSRQAMYAGYRADNPTVSQGQNEGETKEYVNLKDFFSNYLQFTKQIIEDRGNFINYILKNAERLKKIVNKDSKDAKKSAAQSQQIGLPPIDNSGSPIFYNGLPENRVFMGRIQDVYKKAKIPKQGQKTKSRADAATAGGRRNPTPGNPTPPGSRAAAAAARGISGNQLSTNPSPPGSRAAAAAAAGQRGNPIPKPATTEVIPYGPTPTKGPARFANNSIISFADKSTDFDYEDGSNDEAWYQLDFVFEIINLFCSEPKTKNNKIDISQIIIGGHPNLISCDPNVLIPNSISPKINIGRTPAIRGQKVTDGYLESIDANSNLFVDQFYWIDFNKEIVNGQKEEKEAADKIKTNSLEAECVTKRTSPLWKAALKAQNTFKTRGSPRDDLDVMINWLYYEIGGTSNAAFPFREPKTVGNRTYQAHYYGYLKNIYISKSRLIEIGKDQELKTLEQIVNKILNIVNEAVDNFWNLQVVKSETGGLSIIDKNLSLPKKSPIYKFDIGSTSSVIKKIDFQVNLTNEQVNSVLYGSGQNAANDQASKITEIANSMDISLKEKVDKITQIKTGLPSLNYADRFDDRQLLDVVNKKLEEISAELKEQQSKPPTEQNQTVPHGPIINKNEEIRRLQTQGKQDEKVLVMRVRALKNNEDPYGPVEEQSASTTLKILTLGIAARDAYNQKTNTANFGWVYLNLPPTMKGKLREMLDDSDTTNNTSKYSGPADNFTLTLTFDGIFGFRMFQHISIANLPKPYVPGNVIFMINEVDHQINAGKWETTVTAMLRCCPDQEYEFINV